MASPSLEGLIHSFSRKSKFKIPTLKGQPSPAERALKGLKERVGPKDKHGDKKAVRI